jgi:threonine/homoserine/homoserine lactone efflux protein
MGDAIGQMLPSAVGVAVSPLPIIAVVLILVTPRARVNGPAFVLGCWLGIATVGGIVLAVSGGVSASDDGEPATWVGIAQLLLGGGLLFLALKQWRSRPSEGEHPETPPWMNALDSFTPAKTLGVGFLLAGVNPKNLILVAAGAAAIAGTGISAGDQALALLIFVLIGSIGVTIPVAIYFLLGDRSREILDDTKSWLQDNSATIMAVVLLILGVMIVGDGISTLT